MGPKPLDDKAIFNVACSIESADSRNEYLNHVCGDDQQLLDRISTLLRMREEEPDFLAPRVTLAPTLDVAPLAEQPGTQIGRYKLIDEIGQGGMGVVFLAVQKEPVKRKVALKIVKPGMDTREVVKRFDGERQALALMNHQSIAKVLDGGSTESGRPYFVMELVEGTPITEYCDGARYSTQQRLELFGQVCQAVQHAHQKGVIHRDLKPSNILVTNYDHIAMPKVIDFGIARAIHQPLTDQSVYTNVSQMIGTPLYMSPEQAQRSGLDIDTRTDVYSLGVLLYELLTGTTPFDKERLQNSSLDEVKRIIREEDPPKPSARLSTLNAAQETVAEKHSTNLRTLSHELSGELDWIVMKSLEKDRTRRYESANELAKDVQRYLNDEAVEACPPSAGYRLKKLFRRHKAPVLAASVVLVALLVTVAMALTLAVRERQAAQRQLFVQHGINGVLTEVARLRGQVSATALGDQTTLTRAREQMQRALALVDAGPADAHLIAQVRQLASELDQEQRDRQLLSALDAAWLAEPSLSWDRRFANENSVPLLRHALTADGLAVGQDAPQTAAARIKSRQEKVRSEIVAALYEWYSLLSPPIGVVLEDNQQNFGRVAYVSPESSAGRDGRLKKGDRIVGIGQGSGASVTSTAGMTVRQIMQLLRGEPGTSVRLEVLPAAAKQSRTLEIQRDTTAAWLWAVIQAADPDPWRRRVRDACELEDDTLRRAELEKLADAADLAGQPVRFLARLGAELVRVKAIDRATTFLKKVWQAYPDDVSTNISLAICLRQNQPPKIEESLHYYTAVVALRPESSLLRNMRGITFAGLGKYEQAIADLREAIRLKPDYCGAHSNLGGVLSKQRKLEEAVAECREAIRLKPDNAGAHNNLGNALNEQGKFEEAAVACREAVGLQPDFPEAHCNLGNALAQQGKLEEAINEFREVIRLQPDDPEAHNNLGNVLSKQRKHEEATAEYREALRLRPDLVNAHTNLGNAFKSQGKLEEAITCYRQALEIEPKNTAAYTNLGLALIEQGKLVDAIAELREFIRPQPDKAQAHTNLGNALAQQGKLEEAIAAYRDALRLQPDFPEAHNNLGIIFHHYGKHEEAMAEYREALRLRPNLPNAHSGLGNVLCDQGKLEEAIAEYREAIRLDPDRGMLHSNLGNALNEQGKFEEATAACREALRLQPDFPGAHHNLGNVLRDQGKLEEAVTEYREAIRLKPSCAGAHADLAIALRTRGNWEEAFAQHREAVAQYREAIGRTPSDAEAHRDLAWLLATAPDPVWREPAEALELAWKAVHWAPENASYLVTLGTAQYRAGQWEAAIAALEKATTLPVGQWFNHNGFFLAMAHWQLGHQEEARRQFQKAVEWMEKHKPADEELQRFRAETAELLGITETPAEKSVEEEKTDTRDNN